MQRHGDGFGCHRARADWTERHLRRAQRRRTGHRRTERRQATLAIAARLAGGGADSRRDRLGDGGHYDGGGDRRADCRERTRRQPRVVGDCDGCRLADSVARQRRRLLVREGIFQYDRATDVENLDSNGDDYFSGRAVFRFAVSGADLTRSARVELFRGDMLCLGQQTESLN